MTPVCVRVRFAMPIATARAVNPEEQSVDVRAALRRVGERLAHAAELAEASHDGSSPEWGADLVMTVLDGLAPELSVLAAARAAAHK
jgi:hypothetical protein